MNKKTTILSIIILIVAFLAGWALYTYVPAPGNEEDSSTKESPRQIQTDASSNHIAPGPGYRQMVSILDMSPEQASQFSEIESHYRQDVSDLTQQLDSIDTAILSEIKKENPDKEKLDQLAASAGEIQYALKKATSTHFLRVKELCNPEQREKFNEVISDIDRYRHGRRQGPRDGRGQGRQGRGRRWNNQ
ncbi:MAG: periplasmic heavy metal sensor [Marinilabilia sp.]